MPLTETNPDSLALTYARSLFELALSDGGQEKIEDCLGELEDILEMARSDAMFNEFLSSRVLPNDKRSSSLDSIFKGRINDVTLKFLQVLNDKERLGHLPAIIGAFDQLVQEHFGRVEVDLFTAGPVDAAEVQKIRDRLTSVMGKEVILHPYTDASMIGGVRLRIGDQLIDGSVASQMRKLRDKLNVNGGAAIRARASDLLEND